ncbi:MAG TPA: zinc ribbon domain-containing protein [Candidatus Pullilachnospira intestinigallinarum]|nr:zinc ribbon domain-containing protein [Candidatus Pullilachnospira intestinigallinarum]
MFCPNCGNQLPEGSLSCPACGAQLSQEYRTEGAGTNQQTGFQNSETDSQQNSWEQTHSGPNPSWNQGAQEQQNWRQAQQTSFQQPRTRLGITVGMLGAVIYFSALISPVVLGLLAIYVLFLEENRWLKATAIKSVVCYLGFFVVFQIISGIDYFLSIINRMMAVIHWYPNLAFPGSITDALSICRIVFFLVVAFSALKMRGLRIDRIDEFVETHM